MVVEVLSKREILERLEDPEGELAVTPLPDPDQQLDDAGIDLRLGPDLIISRRAIGAVAYDPADVDTVRSRLHDYQEYIRRPFGSAVYLHPGDFALARTLEYISLPNDLAADAAGRSSWGRLGLLIATATRVNPSFSGTVTLELANLGSIPMVLYVGMRVAQISFFHVQV